jgi:flagellar basal-body rod protein FlgG
LKVDNEGTIVTSDVRRRPEIVIPADATNVTINGSGEVQVTVQSDPTPQIVGQFELATFINDAGLLAQGDNRCWRPRLPDLPPASPASTGSAPSSSSSSKPECHVVREMTDLITAQRTYEINSKVIQASDDMMATISQLR